MWEAGNSSSHKTNNWHVLKGNCTWHIISSIGLIERLFHRILAKRVIGIEPYLYCLLRWKWMSFSAVICSVLSFVFRCDSLCEFWQSSMGALCHFFGGGSVIRYCLTQIRPSHQGRLALALIMLAHLDSSTDLTSLAANSKTEWKWIYFSTHLYMFLAKTLSELTAIFWENAVIDRGFCWKMGKWTFASVSIPTKMANFTITMGMFLFIHCACYGNHLQRHLLYTQDYQCSIDAVWTEACIWWKPTNFV